jgi:integrase
VYRVFSENDLVQFFSAIKPSEAKLGLAFFLQLTGGFRVGEVVSLKLQNVDFERGVVSLLTEKANVSSDQPLPFVALEVLREWTQTNGEAIKAKGDFLFFSNALFQQRLAVDVNSLRNFFQKVRARAGLQQSYAEAADAQNPKQQTNRPLYKLSTHSFRRTYGSLVYRESKKKEAVRALLRHLKKDPTDCYIYFDHREQLELVNRTFDREVFKQIGQDLIEKIKMGRVVM